VGKHIQPKRRNVNPLWRRQHTRNGTEAPAGIDDPSWSTKALESESKLSGCTATQPPTNEPANTGPKSGSHAELRGIKGKTGVEADVALRTPGLCVAGNGAGKSEHRDSGT